MNKSVVTIATATSFLLAGGIAQASVKNASVKPAKVTSKSTSVKGTATKSATIKLSRYNTTYAYGKATSKGKFSFKLKHKLHAGWSYRLTVSKKGYKTTHKYLKVSVTKPVKPINAESSSVTTPASISSAASSSSVTTAATASSASNSPATNVPDSSSTETTNATSSTNSSAETHHTPTVSAKEKADLALALKYKAKAIELSQKAADSSNQSDIINRIFEDQVHPVEYYAKLNSQIDDYQQQMKALLTKSPDTTSVAYQTLKYHLDNLQDEKNSAEKQDKYPQKLSALDQTKVTTYRDQYYQSRNQTPWSSQEDLGEAQYFWTLAGKILEEYNLSLGDDWEDGPYTKPTNTEDEIFNKLATDINNVSVKKTPSTDPELLKQQQLKEQKLLDQYDKDYAAALKLVSQYNQNSEKLNSLYTEIKQMSDNIDEFVSGSSDDSDSTYYTQQIKEGQDTLDAMKKANPNYENTSAYQHELIQLSRYKDYLQSASQEYAAYKQAVTTINGDFVGYRKNYEDLSKERDELQITNRKYATQLQQLQDSYRETGLPTDVYNSKNIFKLSFGN